MDRKHVWGSLRVQIALLITLTVLVILVMGSIFYFSAQSLTEQKNVTFVHTLLEQLSDNLSRIGADMSYVADSLSNNDTVQQYLKAETSAKRLEYGQTFSNFAGSLLNYSNSVSHIILVDRQNVIISATEHNIIALDTLDQAYGIFQEDYSEPCFFGPVFDTYSNTHFFVYVRPVYNTRSGARIHEKIGTCVIFSRVALLDYNLKSAAATPGSMLILTNMQGIPVSASGNRDTAMSLLSSDSFSKAADGGIRKVNLNGVSCISDSVHVSTLNWDLTSIVPVHEISVDLKPLFFQGMLICVIFGGLVALWGIHLRHSITHPLAQITDFIEHGLDEKLENRIHISPNKEIDLFCTEINILLDKVAEMTKANIRNQTRMYELSLGKKRAELAALQSQINPHFLYNTLDCLRGFGYSLGSQEIVSITNSLSGIMRYCIKGKDMVTLKEELAIVNSYLNIIRIRFENRFDFIFHLDDDLLSVLIPRFILQPVVENAVYHGLESKKDRGALTIECHRSENGNCELTISDNGVGIDADTLCQLQKKLQEEGIHDSLQVAEGQGLALVNIHNRLRNHFGPQYGLQVSCPAEGGTRVVLCFPCTFANQEPANQPNSFQEAV